MSSVELEKDGALMTLSMGPHHPSTHGVLRLILETDGEVIARCTPDLGYLHRSIEKIGEFVDVGQFVVYTDRVDYVCAMNSNWAWCLAVERLLHAAGLPVVVPERAEYLRVLAGELNRISSHLVAVGAMAMDIGAFTPFLQGIAQRELVNDIFEKLCGARLTYNYVTVGGVSHDLHAGGADEIARFLDTLERELVRFNRLITANAIFRGRLAGLAPIGAADAIAYGLVGPNLRGAGVDVDLRRDEPYSVYDRFTFDVPLGDRFAGVNGVQGDCYDRFVVRCLELFESIRICRQALAQIPPAAAKADDPIGGWQADVTKHTRKLPRGEVYVRSENPRGETGYWLASDGGKTPYRVKIRTGSFTALSIFEKLIPGLMIADLVAVIGSLDIVIPEVDR
jgi:NADH-quinone oxidoreductase subunit D